MATSDLTFEAVDWSIARELVDEFRAALEDEEGGDREIAAAVAMWPTFLTRWSDWPPD